MKVSYILLFFNSLGFFGESVASMEVLYANPGGGGSFGTYDYCGPKISAEIAISTTNKVHVTMYTLTSPELLRKLKDKAAAGKKVCVLVDKYQYEHCPAAAETMKSRIDNLKTSSPNAKVRVLGSDNSNDLMMHEKVAIFSNAGGNHTALLGSYNWTDSASKRHFENCVFLRVGQGVSSINASIIRLKTRFDELWRLSSSLNGGDERDLDCLFTPTPDEQKILRDAAATARSDDRAGGGNPSPGGPSSDSRSERKPMPPSKSSGEGSATPMKRVAIGPSSNPGGFSASVSFSPAAATFSSPRSRKVRFDESSRNPLLSIKDRIAEAEEKAVVESLPPIPVGNKGTSRAFLSPGKSPVMTRGQREEHGRELADEE